MKSTSLDCPMGSPWYAIQSPSLSGIFWRNRDSERGMRKEVRLKIKAKKRNRRDTQFMGKKQRAIKRERERGQLKMGFFFCEWKWMLDFISWSYKAWIWRFSTNKWTVTGSQIPKYVTAAAEIIQCPTQNVWSSSTFCVPLRPLENRLPGETSNAIKT